MNIILRTCPVCKNAAVLNVSLEDQEAFVLCPNCRASVTKEIGLHRFGQTTLEKLEEVLREVADVWNGCPADGQEVCYGGKV